MFPRRSTRANMKDAVNQQSILTVRNHTSYGTENPRNIAPGTDKNTSSSKSLVWILMTLIVIFVFIGAGFGIRFYASSKSTRHPQSSKKQNFQNKKHHVINKQNGKKRDTKNKSTIKPRETPRETEPNFSEKNAAAHVALNTQAVDKDEPHSETKADLKEEAAQVALQTETEDKSYDQEYSADGDKIGKYYENKKPISIVRVKYIQFQIFWDIFNEGKGTIKFEGIPFKLLFETEVDAPVENIYESFAKDFNKLFFDPSQNNAAMLHNLAKSISKAVNFFKNVMSKKAPTYGMFAYSEQFGRMEVYRSSVDFCWGFQSFLYEDKKDLFKESCGKLRESVVNAKTFNGWTFIEYFMRYVICDFHAETNFATDGNEKEPALISNIESETPAPQVRQLQNKGWFIVKSDDKDTLLSQLPKGLMSVVRQQPNNV